MAADLVLVVPEAGVEWSGRSNWSTMPCARRTPSRPTRMPSNNGALLAVLVTCALRRGELSRMNCEHLAMRDGRWVFLDFLGKGNKTRSVAVPLWVKQEIDGWLDVAGKR